MVYDLIIVGGGPAGAGGAVYAARKRLKTLLITYDFGGQSVVSGDIQNWIGTVSLSGQELAENLKKHALAYADGALEVAEGEKVAKIEKSNNNFSVLTDSGKNFLTQAVLITAGSGRRKLNVPGASEFENKGITYCASCDGPMFAGQDVVVIGGGNAGFETAAQLLSYCQSVTLLHHGENFKADALTVEKVLKNPKMKALTNAETMEILGDKFVSGLKYKDKKTGEIKELKVKGVFVEIGQIPNTAFVEGLVEFDEYKRIKIDPWSQKTSQKGVWAAGDSTNVLYHQNNIAAGDGVRAVEDIYLWLRAK